MNQISYLKSQLTKTLPHLLSLSGYYYCWEKPLTDDMHQTYATRPNHATYRILFFFYMWRGLGVSHMFDPCRVWAVFPNNNDNHLEKLDEEIFSKLTL